MPRKRLFLDVETYKVTTDNGSDLPFRLAVTCYEYISKINKKLYQEWKEHLSYEALWDYVVSLIYEKEKLIIFTHNAEFDLMASLFLKYFTSKYWRLDFYYNKGLQFIFSARKDKREIEFISSTNFFAASIDTLGKMFNFPKGKVDFDNVDHQTLAEYCKRDVEICRLAVNTWLEIIKTENYGNFRLTKASQAFEAFRTQFMHYKIYIPCDDEEKAFERCAYFGGRCEALFIGEIEGIRFRKFDFNSNYASVMKKYNYPIKLVAQDRDVSVDSLAFVLERYLCTAYVRIKTDAPIYPIKPGLKLIFPIGEFDCYLNTRALKLALARGQIIKVYRYSAYEGAPIFKPFIDHFYEKKLQAESEGNRVYRTIYKDIMNSLYGKFGQKRPVLEEKIDYEGPDFYRAIVIDTVRDKRYVEYKILNKRFSQIDEEEVDHSFPTVSAHVTEDARLLLWETIEEVGYDNVYYMDTDSLIIKEEDVYKIKHLIDEKRLGYLKDEGGADYLKITAPKHYKFGDEEKHKGIKATDERISENTFRGERFERITAQLIRGKISSPRTYFQTKTINPGTTKGWVSASGRVLPFELPADEPFVFG